MMNVRSDCLGKMFVAFFFVFLFSFTLLPEANAFLKGDINGDDTIDMAESVYSLRVVAGLTTATVTQTISVPADIGTIQEAVNAASPGDTINVAAGTYTETIIISKDNITLQGSGRDTTIIKGNGEDPTIRITNARGVTITGFLIQDGYYGIYSQNSDLECSENRLENNKYGFRAKHPSRISLENTLVKFNTSHGVRIGSGAYASIEDCEFSNNSGRGLAVDRNANVYIGPSTLSNNGSDGIQAFLGATVSVEECEIKNNTGSGVKATGHAAVSFYGDNTISGNGDGESGGISIHQNSNGDICGNCIISSNNGPGIHVETNSSFHMPSGTISNNQGHGVDACCDGTAYLGGEVSITQNSGYGIKCWEAKVFGTPGSNSGNVLGAYEGCD